MSYDGEGRPIEVTNRRYGARDSVISAPVHRLAFGWTEREPPAPAKNVRTLGGLIEQFHYDGVGHLESNLNQNLPAVAGIDGDLVAYSEGLEPRQIEEWWTVNQVDELESRRRVSDGFQFDAQPDHDSDGLHQVVASGNFSYDWDDNGNLGGTTSDAGRNRYIHGNLQP